MMKAVCKAVGGATDSPAENQACPFRVTAGQYFRRCLHPPAKSDLHFRLKNLQFVVGKAG